MGDFFNNLVWWHWLVLGMLLLITEILAPASFFIWIALAAFIMSLLVFVFAALSWPMQLIAFGTLSVVAVLAGRSWFKHKPIASDKPQLNRRGEQYVGRVLVLNQGIVNGYGSVNVDDTRWRVAGPELAQGEKVRVTGIDGTLLHVEHVTDS